MRTMFALLGMAMAGVGCHATHLAYVYDASIGLDVAYSQNGNPKVVFGYDRGTYAIVPQREDARGAPEQCAAPSPKATPVSAGELMTVTAVSHVHANGLGDLQFDHFVATGSAAQRIAKDPAGLKQIRKAIFSAEDQ